MIQSNAMVFALSANKSLAEKVCDYLGVKLSDINLSHFPSGEVLVSPKETVRGKEVYIIQSTCPPVNENLMELLVFIDALRRASAGTINAIIPYFGYARQDRKSKSREPITSKLVADLLVTAGVDRVLTFDLHAAQIQGFFGCIEDDLSAIPLLGYKIFHDESIDKNNLVVVSPDHGGVNRARKIAERLNAPIAIIDKRRNAAYQPEVMNIIGDVSEKECVIVDDMIDTAGSVCAAATALKAANCKDVSFVCTHAVLSDPAYERLSTQHPFKKMYVTDSIPLSERFVNDKSLNIEVCSLAPIIASSIDSINNAVSISKGYEMYNN